MNKLAGQSGQANEVVDSFELGRALGPALGGWRWLLSAAIAGTVAGYLGSYTLTPVFTARTSLLPPLHQQSAAASALASLSPLVGMSGIGAQSNSEEYIALMRSRTVSARIAQRFDLPKVYDTRLSSETLKELAARVQINAGKKDGLITIDVTDILPDRAAKMANAYVDELRRLTSSLALTEAQQRRSFFESKLLEARSALNAAQEALQSSGITSASIKAAPGTAAEAYIRLSADVNALEVKLQTLRVSYAESAPAIRQILATLSASRMQLAQLEAGGLGKSDSNFMGLYRDLKDKEALVESLTRQFEAARLDEAREGTLIQVVDTALTPDRPSGPRRLVIAAAAGILAAMLAGVVLTFRRRGAAL